MNVLDLNISAFIEKMEHISSVGESDPELSVRIWSGVLPSLFCTFMRLPQIDYHLKLVHSVVNRSLSFWSGMSRFAPLSKRIFTESSEAIVCDCPLRRM